MSKVMRLMDGLRNVVANLGTDRDKAAHTTYVDVPLDDGQLYAMYASSWLAAAAVDYPVEDATRKWRTWQGDKDQVAKITELEKRLYLKKVVKDALIAARLYGGAAIYINTPDQNQADELRVGAEVRSLVALGRNQLNAGDVVTDIESPYYGWPETFTVNSSSGTVAIHTSRLVLFGGVRVPAGSHTRTGAFWGESILKRMRASIRNADAAMANIASMIFEAKVDVFQFQGFANLLSDPKNNELITNRLQLQAAMKGINGAVVIDAEDSYEAKSISFGGLNEIITNFQEDAAGAVQIPVTRLFGRSSAGLSGGGDGDERVYYDRIDTDQEDIGQALDLLDRCIVRQATGQDSAEYTWNPLRQMTQSERADNFGKIANAARALAGAHVGEIVPIDALSDAVVDELIAGGHLSGLESAIEKYGSLAEQERLGYDEDDY